MDANTTTEPSRVSALAQSLDCLSEHDLCTLAGIAPATAESWRKRRKGPAYILAGNNYLYPRSGVAQWLETQKRERTAAATGGLL
jgi:predicted site-specific integrase-resolvase